MYVFITVPLSYKYWGRECPGRDFQFGKSEEPARTLWYVRAGWVLWVVGKRFQFPLLIDQFQ